MEITQLFLESIGLQRCVLKQYDLKTNIYIYCDILFIIMHYICQKWFSIFTGSVKKCNYHLRERIEIV